MTSAKLLSLHGENGNFSVVFSRLCLAQFQKRSSPPPGQTPGHLTFLKMLDQIPCYMGRFQGQMPQWLGLKSQNFHNLSGIDERIVNWLKKYAAHKLYGTRIKKPGQKLRINASHGSKIVMYLRWQFCSFEGFVKTLSASLTLFCAERFISVVCFLPTR